MPLPAMVVFTQFPIVFSYFLFGLNATMLYFLLFAIAIGIQHIPERKTPFQKRREELNKGKKF